MTQGNLSEADQLLAIRLMADRMEDGARYVGPFLHCIAGDKTILAERAFEALMEQFVIARKSPDV